ncbi:glycoside hydrolase family 57 protein [Candidatus Saccharibacteria bacterium]|nr:glycoside hydrolase family 57 protein [Candidatus Saccharibacteria bacterium]
MRAITLYFHVHQPYRYREYSIFDVSNAQNYWDDPNYNGRTNNERIFRKVAEKSYYPGFKMLEENLAKYPGFKCSLSITGTWLDQALAWCPDLIEQIRRMVNTGRVEIVAETYYHSLSFFYNRAEFEDQVQMHREKIFNLFGVECKVFRNTELAYNDELAHWAEEAGFRGILAEGWDKILGWRSPNHVYRPAGCQSIKLLLKNYRLSDDIAFRFSDRNWPEWPLTVEKYQRWVNMDCLRGELINLFMDFETFGEHQWADTGIFQFMNHFIYSWLKEYENKFLTVSEACDLEEPVDEVSMPWIVTWADTERDLSAWVGNAIQDEALSTVYGMRDAILATQDACLISDWRRLTTSDHSYAMCTKYWNDGDVHAYFSAYASPYEAFMYYMNVVRDINYRLGRAQ